jgi:hypothetical protein
LDKETRFNLIFLVALLLISAPGVVLLIGKQLKPGARRLADPPYVRRTEAYNNPLPASSASVRVAPPITAAWVEAVTIEQLGHPALRHQAAGGRREPIMSEGRRFELLGLDRDGDGATLALLGWLAELGRGDVQAIDAEAECLGILEGVEVVQLDVPPDVIKELKGIGFVTPPTRVGLTRLRFTLAAKPGSEAIVRLRWHLADDEGQDVLNLHRVLPADTTHDKDQSGDYQ